jgi:Putative Actinobacterial Holin-X, holin superfamily III
MSVETTTDMPMTTETPMTNVMGGIVDDFQKLMTQQVALLRAEVKRDWDKTKMAMCPIAAGAALGLVALLQLGIAAGLGIYAAASPAGIDPARIPMWGCFALAGLAFGVVSGVLLAIGTRAFQSFNPLPDETIEAFEKNLQSFVTTTSASRGVGSLPR